MLYEVGDKVQVRTDLVAGDTYGKYKAFSDVMTNAGKKVTIDQVYERAGYYGFAEAIGRGFLTDEMIEQSVPKVQPMPKPEPVKDVRYNETVTMWKGMHDKKTFRIIMKNHITTLVQQYDTTGGLGDLDELIEYTRMLQDWELTD